MRLFSWIIVALACSLSSAFATCNGQAFSSAPIDNVVSSSGTLYQGGTNQVWLAAFERTAPGWYTTDMRLRPTNGPATGVDNPIVSAAYDPAVSRMYLNLANSWANPPVGGNAYVIVIPGTVDQSNGQHWCLEVVTRSTPYGNYRGGSLQLSFDGSKNHDWSVKVPVDIADSWGKGANGSDAQRRIYTSVMAIESGNDLTSPCSPDQWNPGACPTAATHNGTKGISNYDVTPQFVLFPNRPSTPGMSIGGSIQWDTKDRNGNHVVNGFLQMRQVQDVTNSVYSRFYFAPAGAPYGWNLGGDQGGIWSEGLWDAGPGTIHTRGCAVYGVPC